MFRQQRIQLFQRLDIAKDVGHMAQHKAVCAVSNGLFRLFQQQRILPQCTAQHGQLEVVPLDQFQYRAVHRVVLKAGDHSAAAGRPLCSDDN